MLNISACLTVLCSSVIKPTIDLYLVRIIPRDCLTFKTKKKMLINDKRLNGACHNDMFIFIECFKQQQIIKIQIFKMVLTGEFESH